MQTNPSQASIRLGAAILSVVLAGGALQARTKVAVTAPDGFSDGIDRIALVAQVCAPQLDCPDVIKRVTATVKTELKLKFEVVTDTRVREELQL